MAKLTIIQNGRSEAVSFEGHPVLDEVLIAAGYLAPHPCGGRGSCGKCAVLLDGNVSEPNDFERLTGRRLSCQTVLLGDTIVVLPDEKVQQIETAIEELAFNLCPMTGRYGAAVDIGTTTVAVKVYELTTGTCIGESALLNPQTAVAADVMGRIEASCKGMGILLQHQILGCIGALLRDAVMKTNFTGQLDTLVLTGNTTMLYLLTGIDPEPLSHAPFHADCLFDTQIEILGSNAYLPPCMNAFVGADITCAVLTSGMCQCDDVALLCDIGTNGELALWKDGNLFVTSTAAGPAFEGAGITCGCGSVDGAIDRVWLEGSKLHIHTIGDSKPVGLCGSGLIDAIAAGLMCSAIDETGVLSQDEFLLSEDVRLLPKDIRSVQLAKAAIAAGIATLTETAGVAVDEIKTLYIAGGFGSHLNVNSAATIGLIPEVLKNRVKVLGNASLAGAVRALLNTESWQELRRIANAATHVDLGGNPLFSEKYIEHMLFE